MKLKRLGHLLLRVADIKRSKEFYTRILGFYVLEEDPKHEGGVVFLGLGENSHTIDLLPALGEKPAPSGEITDLMETIPGHGVHHIAFPVDTREELEEAYWHLTDNGVKVLAAMDHVNQQSIYFLDPDNTPLEIYWERPNVMEIWRKGRGDADSVITFTRRP